MDLRLYRRVLWRFRFIVAMGMFLAIALAFLSYARVSFAGGKPTLSYRQSVVWGSTERLLLTQKGFPEGRTSLPVVSTPNGLAATYADPSRFSNLAGYYSNLANSDTLTGLVRKRLGAIKGGFVAGPVLANYGTVSVQPILEFDSRATSPLEAVRIASIASATFRVYLAKQQTAANIPPSQRVVISVLNRARDAAVLTPRKKTLAIVVFIAALAATVALAFLLENLRPRIRAVEGLRGDADAIESRRSTA